MTSQFLPVFVQNALEDNEELLPDVVEGRADFSAILEFCQNFRTAGIGALFLGSAPKVFRQMLHHSGRAYAHFLGYADPRTTLTSKALPFFDAVASGDFDGAALIARSSRRSWAQGEEYEEDFLFAEFLMQQLFLGATPRAGADMLERYEAALQGSEDSRLAVCKALLDDDADGFNASLALFLSERGDLMAELNESGALMEEESATEGNLCVEGLALVRLAEHKGLETERDYLHVPSTARKGGRITFSAEAWRKLWD
ncbi:Imm49 family immunity protein [Myxococcus sp. RHSTA-1-4]|uniref:Imm49 family immunity protein n=1 Tax=Myxococcus sp. RHSTA-1-4 TaxID=2874601 RepID=UPI001CBFE65F|nr:Imm49 family immunity protein [Myxococcus sp. RHSTA-1-4]MBZ4415082.1 immunity 49 family protein [Myxococcus sp. RHSTA-1-4]